MRVGVTTNSGAPSSSVRLRARLLCALALACGAASVCAADLGWLQEQLDAGRVALVLPQLEAAVRADPASAQAQLLLGTARHRSGDLSGARAALDRAVALAPDRVEGFLRRGELRIDLKDWPGSEADLERAVQLAPENAEAQYWRGYRHAIDARDRAAIQCYDRSLALDPESARTWYARATARMRRNDFKGARADARESILRDRSDEASWSLLAEMESKLGAPPSDREKLMREAELHVLSHTPGIEPIDASLASSASLTTPVAMEPEEPAARAVAPVQAPVAVARRPSAPAPAPEPPPAARSHTAQSLAKGLEGAPSIAGVSFADTGLRSSFAVDRDYQILERTSGLDGNETLRVRATTRTEDAARRVTKGSILLEVVVDRLGRITRSRILELSDPDLDGLLAPPPG